MKQVAFLVPTCSYNLPDSQVHEQHLIKIFIKSLLSYTPDFDIRMNSKKKQKENPRGFGMNLHRMLSSKDMNTCSPVAMIFNSQNKKNG